ncbi:MAG: metallopeptidase TldD-related protein, partial [Myxococcota bacterium]|nr:metallopeptidase TldD-related protein [Myxococcota bacterium]
MYRAPFAPDGPAAIDERTAAALLDVALETGGDWADMFFEYDVAASWTYEDAILKSAGRSVTMGVGVRVMHGECTGYAYVEDFAPQSIRNAARAAARIARSAARGESVRLEAVSVADRYPVEVASVDVEGAVKRELLRRADAAARAADPSIRRVEVSLAEQYREILVASSDGRFARDRQPMLRFGIRVIAERGGLRQAGSSGGGGRIGLEYFERCSPEVHAREAVRHALAMIDARPAPAGELPVVLAPGDSGILLHEAVGHGLEADFNRKKVSRYSDRLGERVASPLCTVVDDAT